MPAKKLAKSPSGYYRAKAGFVTMYNGEQTAIAAGEIVRAGHDILDGRAELFEPVESFGRFDVEQATAAPGETKP